MSARGITRPLAVAFFANYVDIIAAFGFNSIAEGHEWLTAFITRFGLFGSFPPSLPLWVTGSTGTFQNYVNDILHDIVLRSHPRLSIPHDRSGREEVTVKRTNDLPKLKRT